MQNRLSRLSMGRMRFSRQSGSGLRRAGLSQRQSLLRRRLGALAAWSLLVAGITAALVSPLSVASAQTDGMTMTGGFTESSANDGSVTGVVTATLSDAGLDRDGDGVPDGGFVAIDSDGTLAGADNTTAAVSVSMTDAAATTILNTATGTDPPNGLVPVFTRVDPETITLTLSGTTAAHFDDVDLTVTFTTDAFATPASHNGPVAADLVKTDLKADFHPNVVWTWDNGDGSGFRAFDAMTDFAFGEADANDGSINQSHVVRAVVMGSEFVANVTTNDPQRNIQYITYRGAPDDLVMVPSRLATTEAAYSTTVDFRLGQKALQHAMRHSVTDGLSFEFLPAAFTAEGDLVGDTTMSGLGINFANNITIGTQNFKEGVVDDGSSEDNANDGSVGPVNADGTLLGAAGGLTVTLNEVTTGNAPSSQFAAVVDHDDDTNTPDIFPESALTITGVPAGLMASVARTSNTVLTITLIDDPMVDGDGATAHAPLNSVANVAITVNDSAFAPNTPIPTDATRRTRNDIRVDFGPSITWAYGDTTNNVLREAADDSGRLEGTNADDAGTPNVDESGTNDTGSANNTVTATLPTGLQFVPNVASHDITNRSTIYIYSRNVPAGLTVTPTLNAAGTVVTFTFTGKATSHDEDVGNIVLGFNQSAFLGQGAATLSAPSRTVKNDIIIDFIPSLTITTSPFVTIEGGFSEADANDGSVTGEVTATLTGDTFTAGVASHVTVSNAPAGLSSMVTRTSDTMVTITLTGNATSHFEDVDDLTVTFGDGAFTNSDADDVEGSSKSDVAVDFNPNIAYAGSFTEAAANDGSVTGEVTATLSGDEFAADADSHVTASNVPAGLTAEFARTSATVITLTLTGNATDHTDADDVADLGIEFGDGAFTASDAAHVGGSSTSDLAIDFMNLNITYAGSFSEAAANDGSVDGSVTATLSGDTFAADADSHVTVSNVPAGLTAEVTRTSDTVVTVTLSGNADDHADDVNLTITFGDDAFANAAAADVDGSTSSAAVGFNPNIAWAGSFSEARANNGSVEGSVTATLSGDTFAADADSHVTASNVPAGLTAEFARTSATVVTVTLSGRATAHRSSNDVADLTVTFADGAFEDNVAADVGDSTNSGLEIDFNNPPPPPPPSRQLPPPPPRPTPTPTPTPDPTPTPTPDPTPDPEPEISQGDIEVRDDLIAAQENLLNAYRCLAGIDVEAVAGGCDGTDPAEQIEPGPAPEAPTQDDIDVRDELVANQEALLNEYRCMLNRDTELVPGGCDDDS